MYDNVKMKPLFTLTVEDFFRQLQGFLHQSEKTEPVSNIIGIEEASKLSGYKNSTLYRKTSDKTIPFHKRGNKIYFLRDELEKWMLENRQETTQEYSERLNNQMIQRHK